MELYRCLCGHSYLTVVVVVLAYAERQPIDPCPACGARGGGVR